MTERPYLPIDSDRMVFTQGAGATWASAPGVGSSRDGASGAASPGIASSSSASSGAVSPDGASPPAASVPSVSSGTDRPGTASLANGATASRLDGGRLFLQHGPINLIVRVDGPESAVEDACRALIDVFPYWLGTLVEELSRLRSPETPCLALPAGPIACRMVAAVRACTSGFVTPMAAVAGAVADEAAVVLAAQPGIERAFVNNGGDIALHLSRGARMSVGVVPSLREAIPRARIEITSDSAVRGVATSGWQGRSHSLGIADAVTVLARSAALADAAATLVANAVDIDHPGIRREPACVLDEDSDLGDRLVTVAVPALDADAIGAALDTGLRSARELRARGVIEEAALSVQGRWRVLEGPGVGLTEQGLRAIGRPLHDWKQA